MAYSLLIHRSNGTIYEPIVKDEIVWDTERFGTAGKLTFTIVKDDTISFEEGDWCTFRVDDKNVFAGRILTKSRNKDQHIECTAYDQTFYFKNSDTFIYDNLTLGSVIRKICNDYQLTVGTLVDTDYPISRVEDSVSLWDMIGNAMDETLVGSSKQYVVYDDFGKIMLRDMSTMRVNYLLDKDVAIDYDYSTSVIDDTYNRIKLVYDNEDAGSRDVYIAEDSQSISQWGLLQYYGTLDTPDIGENKVRSLLALKNRKTRKLSTDVIGDLSVRAGVYFPINLNVGDIVVNQYLIAEKVSHKFNESNHTMNLTVSGGGGFIV